MIRMDDHSIDGKIEVRMDDHSIDGDDSGEDG